MRRLRLIPTVALATGAAAARLGAQWQLTGDVGVSRLQQTGIPAGGAGIAGVTLDAGSARAWLQSSILAARAAQDRWTGQGLITGTMIGPSAAAPRWQLDAVASAFAQSNALPTTSGELAARLRAGGAALGGAVGGAAGATTRAGTSSATWRGLADAWASAGTERFFGSLALTSAPVLGVVPRSAPTPRVRYLDLLTGWRHEVGGLSIGAAAGIRDGMGEVVGGTWGAADASLWLTSHAALVLAAGTTLPDVVRGTPRSTYVSAALRIAARPHVRLEMRRQDVSVARARLSAGANGVQRIEIVASGASRVELRGDFTDWRAVPLEPRGGVFRLELPLPPGLHRLSVRIDGGDWIAPANLPRVGDGSGGAVGLLTVP